MTLRTGAWRGANPQSGGGGCQKEKKGGRNLGQKSSFGERGEGAGRLVSPAGKQGKQESEHNYVSTVEYRMEAIALLSLLTIC